MAVRIRLMRMGMKKAPQYRVVVADSRAWRDGRACCRYLYVSPARPAFYAGPHFYESGDVMSTAADLPPPDCGKHAAQRLPMLIPEAAKGSPDGQKAER